MNIPQEERALKKLSPQKYTIRILVIAVVSLFTAIPVVWKERTAQINEAISDLKQCNLSKMELSERIRLEDQKYDRDRAEKAESDRRRSDSLLLILTLTQNEVKKATKNAKK